MQFRKWMLILIVAVIFLVIYMITEITFFRREEIKIKSKKIKDALVFIHITDYHNNGRINLADLKEAIAEENADGIFFTGDMQENYRISTEKSLRLFRKLGELDLPMIAVLGNHEEGPEKKEYIAQMEALGVTVLQDQALDVKIKGNNLRIIGTSYNPDIDKYLRMKEGHEDVFQLVLIHASHKIRPIVDGKEDLILAGHTHGGQCRFPLVGTIYAPGEGYFPKYDKGVYVLEGHTKLYINTGLGNTFLPLRFLNPVKYARIELTGEELSGEEVKKK